jgi:hypothetical protein
VTSISRGKHYPVFIRCRLAILVKVKTRFSKGSLMVKRLLPTAVVFGVVCWSGPCFAEQWPKQTRDVVRVCSSHSLPAEIFDLSTGKKTSCEAQLSAGDAIIFGSGPGCVTFIDEYQRSAAKIAQRVLDWLRANRSNSSNNIDDDIDDATGALYRCRTK